MREPYRNTPTRFTGSRSPRHPRGGAPLHFRQRERRGREDGAPGLEVETRRKEVFAPHEDFRERGGPMKAHEQVRSWILMGVVLFLLAPAMSAAAPPKAVTPATDPELEVGHATFNELKKKGEIIESSPLYNQLLPVVEPIMKGA